MQPFSNDEISELRKKADEDRRTIADAIGIDPDSRPITTVYNPASGMIVVAMERYSAEVFERRLFTRHHSERCYCQPIKYTNLPADC